MPSLRQTTLAVDAEDAASPLPAVMYAVGNDRAHNQHENE